MFALKLNYKKLFVGILTIALVSCSDPWGDRQSDDANLNVSLSEAITNTAETSKFAEALVKTGYDKVLSESKAYTVFAPTNEAMAVVDPSILNDPAQLTFFVQNHIALTAYSSVRDKASEKVKMLSAKYLVFKGSTIIDDATIVAADKYAANGVFHIINKALSPKKNIWQYVNGLSATSAMSKYLISLTDSDKNIYKADSIAKLNPIPGRYSDSLTNSYLRNVYNLNNEKNSYTLFLMEDSGYGTEVDKLKPYLIKNSAARTDMFTSYFTARDMAFPKAYLPNELPAVLTTRFGVNVPIDKTQIVGSPIILSNGIVYRIKKVDVPLVNRLVTTKIEGESTDLYSPLTSTARSKILYREVKDPLNVLFNDIVVKNPGFSSFTLHYSASDVYSTTYKVYWRAVNDLQTTVISQRLMIGTVYTNGVATASIKDFGYKDVAVKFYDEVYIGDFTPTQAGNIDLISLLASATATTGYTVTLDYLKFVPVVK